MSQIKTTNVAQIKTIWSEIIAVEVKQESICKTQPDTVQNK